MEILVRSKLATRQYEGMPLGLYLSALGHRTVDLTHATVHDGRAVIVADVLADIIGLAYGVAIVHGISPLDVDDAIGRKSSTEGTWGRGVIDV